MLYATDCCPHHGPAYSSLSEGTELLDAFKQAMRWLHTTGSFSSKDLTKPAVKRLINAIYTPLKEAVNSGLQSLKTGVSEALIKRLQTDVYVFSGMKTYVQLKEAANALYMPKADGSGQVIKPYAQYEADTLKLHQQYNVRHLATEYQYAVTTAQNAARWQRYEAGKERYHLRYLTDNGPNVRPSHRALEGTTLPVDDPFWNQYAPKNGWNCHCYLVQVRIGEYPVSDSAKAQALGEVATTELDKKGGNAAAMFRYNPGKQQVIFPPKHPYAKATPEGVKEDLKALAATNNKTWLQDYKRQIYNRPLSEQYTEIYKSEGGGKVLKHLLVDENANDYEDVLGVARAFANESNDVEILPIIHQKENEARAKLFPDYKSGVHSADLRVKNSYWEVEKTDGTTKRNVRDRIKDGLVQAENVYLIMGSEEHLELAKSLLKDAAAYRVEIRKPA